ncbi:sugar/nucleoside kinase (ribokinase family) [Streptomyces canus]|nr:sugar/nucleoside kinase (ribokinase family) [Streptomyces canus]
MDVVDIVGAGDSFTAGLLHRLAALGHLGGRLDALSSDDVTDACTFAAHVVALTCSVPGADPPWAETSRSPFPRYPNAFSSADSSQVVS